MTPWFETLYRELDEWNYDGVEATLWWRDDDAQRPSAELDTIIDLAQKYAAPLALAVIPRGMDGALATRLQPPGRPPITVAVLQHGFAHANHARRGEKKAELDGHRTPAAIHAELAAGFSLLRDAFGGQFVPALTPPWNRIAPTLVAGLAQTGFIGLSTFAPRREREPAPGIRAVNTHVDLIDWKNRKRFVGAEAAVEAMVAHLQGRRLGHFDSAEPTGLLTHHLVHDADCRQFLPRLLAVLDEHPAAKWLTAEAVFARRIREGG